MTRLRPLALLTLLALPACSVALDKNASDDVTPNSCSSGSDCGPDGECFLGACVAHEGQIGSVLLEVTAPPNNLGVPGNVNLGGTRYLQTLDGLERSSEGQNLFLQRNTTVSGFVLAPTTECARTFPLDVTFTPREEQYGLPVVSYTGRTTRVAVPTICNKQADGLTEIDAFSVPVPSGSYDVYVKPQVPAGQKGAPECNLVPQLVRRVTFDTPGESCLTLNWTQPTKLEVVIPWDNTVETLEGWTIEVVHPYTSQVLSAKETLADAELKRLPAGSHYEHTIQFMPVTGEEPGHEIVRLTPPVGVIAPVIQAERLGLQTTSNQAIFPPIGPFPAPVTVTGWVDKAGESGVDVPAAATVSFTAITLTGVKPGIFASYSTTAVVTTDGEGELRANVLPGKYRARIVPTAGSGLAAMQVVVDVKCDSTQAAPDVCLPRDPTRKPPERGGQHFLVPQAATVSGKIVDAVTGDRVSQVTVDALPADTSARACSSDDPNSACELLPLNVLDVALAEDTFVPRAVSDIAPSGSFRLSGLDCGDCKEGASGATFDIVARPPIASRRAWAVKPRIEVFGGDTDLDPIEVPLPIIHRGNVSVPQARAEPVMVQNAHLLAYVFRDADGRTISNPSGIQPCAVVAAAAGQGATPTCIRSVLQVAETQADADGNFELVLPSVIPSSSK